MLINVCVYKCIEMYLTKIFHTILREWQTKLFECVKVLEKCTKNLIGHSRLAFNNHESNIDC